MSDPIRYHVVQPENSQTSYEEMDNIDFVLVADGRKLMKNSIRIEADVEVETNTGNAKGADADLRLSHMAGAHCFFESWQCETESAGVLQNLQAYPRYVNMVASATLDADDLCDAHYLNEMRNPCSKGVSAMIEGNVSYNDNTSHAVQTDDSSFSIKPAICFNRMTGDYSFSKKGFIRVSCNLARNNHALFGLNATATVNYKLKNVVLKFVSVPDDGKDEKLLMRSYVNIKSTIESQTSHIQARVPSRAVNAVSISFLKQGHESGNNLVDTNALEALEQLDEVTYLFNNSSSNYVTYAIDDRADMVKKGLEAFADGDHNQATGNKLSGNKGFLIGLNFEETIDLSNQRYSVQLKVSDATISTQPRIAFLYFHELLSL